MPRAEGSIVINRPLEEVFDYVSNVDNFPEWAGGAIEVHEDEPSPLREGYRFTVVASLLGRRFENRYELASYEPPRHYKHRGTGGPIPNQEWTYTFEEVAGGTYLTRAVEGEPGSFFKLADPLIERFFQRQIKSDLETLKDLLEAQG